MSFSSIQTTPQADGFTVIVALPDGRTISQLVDDAVGVLPVAVGCWGVDGSGKPYFDSAGASPGERAVLGFSPATGQLYLETATDPTLTGFALRELRESARIMVGELDADAPMRKLRESARMTVIEPDANASTVRREAQNGRHYAAGHRRRYSLQRIVIEPECDEPNDPAAAREARQRASGNRRR